MTEFRGRARAAISGQAAVALDRGARRLTAARLAADAAYPPMAATRDEARRIRLETLAGLDRHLARFADEVTAAGGAVSFAADAEEANAMIVAIAARHGARLIVKSKSMVTEEIGLNAALTAAACEVVETDLGEFIAQLDGDHPSHIIAPVLHKTRQQIGRLFADRLGVPYTDDPVRLNAIARAHLRDIFLRADMGVSGCNFAVAENGAVCLVTNEGNGRLTTTLPRVHVVVMGMERIVPTMKDLSVMLEVLARSGTGQRLSVYTNVVRGPRAADEPDGPDVFEVIVVDNGRSRLLAGELAEVLACIRCGACLNVCPVYRHVGGHAYGFPYSGPIGAVIAPTLSGAHHGDLPFASTLCGACREACPVRIDLPRLLVEARSQSDALSPTIDRSIRWFRRVATHPAAWRAALRGGGALGSLLGEDGWISSAPLAAGEWTRSRDLLQPGRPFRARWKERDGT